MDMVVDCSVVLAWCLADEDSPVADAAYLEVARRRALPLCTLDTPLRRAAQAAGPRLWRDR